MADPTNGLDTSDWIKMLISSSVTGLGSAVAWLRGMKQVMESRMADIEREQHRQGTTIAVLESQQSNIADRLEDIQLSSQDVTKRIESLQNLLTQFIYTHKQP